MVDSECAEWSAHRMPVGRQARRGARRSPGGSRTSGRRELRARLARPLLPPSDQQVLRRPPEHLSILCAINIYLTTGGHSMSEQPTVADYIVRRLAREGITDCFGVAGDFAFKLCAAAARSEAIRWIGCSNELDAAYAADGYARVRGCSMLMTTYAVGELSALNGVMGAK